MNRSNDRSAVAQLPPKTGQLMVWIAVFGTIALLGHHQWGGTLLDDSDLDEGPVVSPPGPLPAVARPPVLSPAPSASVAELMVPSVVAAERRPPTRQVIQLRQAIEDPHSRAMCPFYRALDELEGQRPRSSVRILHYGDSILSTDQLSGQIRRTLQHRFGDAGHGFVLLGKPWSWYRHLDVKHGARGNWRPRPLTSDPVSDGMFGLGGVAFETWESNAVAWAGTAKRGPLGTRVASFDLSYLAHPRGGSFDVLVNNRVVRRINTKGDSMGSVHQQIDVVPGGARLKVRTVGNGKVRLFGVTLKSDQPGIVYDSLAINGARVATLERFDKTHWQSELAHAGASLVVLMFGANEAHRQFVALDEYRQHLEQIIRTMRQGAPNAAFLVVGPLDQARRRPDGLLRSRRMPAKLSQLQRQVALNEGCAFYDTYSAMGGKNSMAAWFRKGWGGGDLIHPTGTGSRILGSWISDALLAGYEHYADGEISCGLSVTSL